MRAAVGGGLKAFNAKTGEAGGDEVLKVFGGIARAAGGHAFDFAHLHGDEYAARHDHPVALADFLDRLRAMSDDVRTVIRAPDGSLHEVQGLHFGQGIGATDAEAESTLAKHKLELELTAVGERGPDADARRLRRLSPEEAGAGDREHLDRRDAGLARERGPTAAGRGGAQDFVGTREAPPRAGEVGLQRLEQAEAPEGARLLQGDQDGVDARLRLEQPSRLVKMGRVALALDRPVEVTHAEKVDKPVVERGTFRNEDTGWDIDVGARSEGKSSQLLATESNKAALQVLPELLRRAVRTESVEDRKARRNILAVHTLYAPMEVDGALHRVRLVVREVQDGDSARVKQYALESEGMEKGAPASSDGRRLDADAASHSASPPTTTIGELLRGGKWDDRTPCGSRGMCSAPGPPPVPKPSSRPAGGSRAMARAARSGSRSRASRASRCGSASACCARTARRLPTRPSTSSA